MYSVLCGLDLAVVLWYLRLESCPASGGQNRPVAGSLSTMSNSSGVLATVATASYYISAKEGVCRASTAAFSHFSPSFIFVCYGVSPCLPLTLHPPSFKLKLLLFTF